MLLQKRLAMPTPFCRLKSFLVLGLLAVTAAGCKPTVETVQATDDPDELMEIVWTENVEADVQFAALAKLDQLGRQRALENIIKDRSVELVVARESVATILGRNQTYIRDATDQEVLAFVAIAAADPEDRLGAAQRLTDAALLGEIARHGSWRDRSQELAELAKAPDMKRALRDVVCGVDKTGQVDSQARAAALAWASPVTKFS